MEGSCPDSTLLDAVHVKEDPGTEFTDHEVKSEPDLIKEEPDWEDAPSCGARAGLYAGHAVKDELVLGPEGLQPADVVFAFLAASVGAGCTAPSLVGAQPALKDCYVKLKRIDPQVVANMCRTVRSSVTTPVDSAVFSVSEANVAEKLFVCAICRERFDVRAELLAHAVRHIHSEQERDNVHITEAYGDGLIKSDTECVEEPDWGDMGPCGSSAGLSGLYAGHVKGEVLLGPEGLQPPDVVFALRVDVGGASPAPSRGRGGQRPALRDCFVRLERLDDRQELLNHKSTLMYIENDGDMKKETYSDISGALELTSRQIALRERGVRLQRVDHYEKLTLRHDRGITQDPNVRRNKMQTVVGNDGSDTKVGAAIESHVCDICSKMFALKSQLIKHVMVHIYTPTSDRSGRSINLVASNQGRLSARPQPLTPSSPTVTPGQRTRETNKALHMREKPHSCDICQRKYTNLSNLKRHKQMHTTEKPYTCNTCKMQFMYLWNLRIHLQIHAGEKPHCCPVCNKRYSQLGSLNRHKLNHTGVKSFSCDICGKQFWNSNSLHNHKRTHSVEKPFTCDVCNKRYKDLGYLGKHMKLHSGEKPHSCKVCGMKFPLLHYLTKHERTHAGLLKPHSCEICEKNFSRLAHLRLHLLTHSSERPFSCDVCKKTFKNFRYLKTHKLIHTGENPYVCEICTKGFRQLTHLRIHTRVHTGERPYPCKVCGKKFATSSALKQHNLIHTGSKPYCCEMCRKRFSLLGALKRHRRTHTGEKPYSCDICKKRFTRSTTVEAHKQVHEENPYKCQICKQLFTNLVNLKRHKRVHTKLYCCDICEAQFTRKKYLVGHILRHGTSGGLRGREASKSCTGIR